MWWEREVAELLPPGPLRENAHEYSKGWYVSSCGIVYSRMLYVLLENWVASFVCRHTLPDFPFTSHCEIAELGSLAI